MAGSTGSLTEHQLQRVCMEWVDIKRKSDPRYWQVFAVPNAAKRSLWEAKRHKAEGMLAGVSDILIFHPSHCGTYHGAALELKVGRNRPTESQVLFLERSKKAGMLTKVVRSFEEFRTLLTLFFGG